MMPSHTQIDARISEFEAKWKEDDSFRKEILANPGEAIPAFIGASPPAGMEWFLKAEDGNATLVMRPKPGEPLSEEMLDKVTGGVTDRLVLEMMPYLASYGKWG